MPRRTEVSHVAPCTLCELPTPDPPVTVEGVEGTFCCRGCLEVYRALGDVEAADVDAATLRDEEASDADAPPADAETAYLAVDGMHCATCESFLEARAMDREGVHDAAASYATDVLRVTHDPAVVDEAELPAAVSGLGYDASLSGAGDADADGPALDWRLYLGVLLGMQLMMVYLVFLYPTYYGWFPTAAGASLPVLSWVLGWGGVVVFWVGFPILRGAYVSVRTRRPNMDLLVALGALVAYGYSVGAVLLGRHEIYVDVATMLVVVVTVGDHVERRFKRDAAETLASLTRSRATEARRLTADGGTETVAVDAVDPGDRLLVRAGERVPVDGTVIEGTAAVDESMLTGESVPATKGPDDRVVGGSTVTDGSLTVAVGADAESTLDRVVELLWDVQSGSGGVSRLADRLARVFVPAVLVLATATALGWVALGRPPRAALLTGVAVLVVSCPCSFGLATPLALVSGVRTAADRDVVVLNTAALERIDDTDVVAIDKTGTLTTGEMSVVDVTPLDAGGATDAREILARAAAVESRSNHPVAAAVRDRAGPTDASVREFERHARGVSARVDGVRVAVGRLDHFEAGAWTVPTGATAAVESARADGVLPLAVGWDGAVRGVVGVRDDPRPDWEAVLSRVADADRRVVVVTGDDAAMATPFEAHPAVDEVLSEVRPEAKVAVVERLRQEGTTTMVGDGTNDAPALARADFGVAMACGTDVAVDAADAVVTADSLDPVVDAFEVAAGTRRRVRQNLAWAFSYNLVAVPLAVAGLVDPLLASVAMAASSVVVVANSARPVVDE
ncbi:MAG: heavy metal translocating P-type ATPase [Halobacteriaceae archaeon]